MIELYNNPEEASTVIVLWLVCCLCPGGTGKFTSAFLNCYLQGILSCLNWHLPLLAARRREGEGRVYKFLKAAAPQVVGGRKQEKQTIAQKFLSSSAPGHTTSPQAVRYRRFSLFMVIMFYNTIQTPT